MRTPPLHLVSVVSIVIALSAAGCSSPGMPGAPVEEEVGTSAAAITAADAIARAEEWVAAKLLYCQSPNGADDTIDPACPPVCMRMSNAAWDPYRSDCSGLVSWAWGLPAPGRTTAELAPNQSDITSVIDASTLAMGDAVNTDDSASNEHHIMLFKAWTIPGQEATFIEEPGCSATPNYAHEFTSSVMLQGSSITVQYSGITFTAIHYSGLTQGGSSSSSSSGGGTGGTYAASYVSQTWPLSSDAPIQMTAGQAQTGSIDMTNTGTATWKAGVVKLAPIPRDQPSNFRAPSWPSATRVSTLTADVPPGGVGHFEWDLDPSQPGAFMPYFGLVAEGITWFADEGGPPDNDIQVNVQVAPGMGTSSSGAPGGAGGASGGGGASGSGAGHGSSGSAGTGGGLPHTTGGCQVPPGTAPATPLPALTALLLLGRRRATRRPRASRGLGGSPT